MCQQIKCSLLLILLMFISRNEVNTEKIEIKCPEFCECDVYQNLRRAVCRQKRLVSIELNIPPQADILDISENQIGELGDKIFLEIGLTDLKLLNMSHNKLNRIHFNGFVGLEKLKTLDLSFNAIQYFTESWFVSLSSLQELYLRGNKLRSINKEPLIDIKTLRVLDLSKCAITHLDPSVFTMLPNLEMLDISENYLQKLIVDVLKPIPKLTLLKAMDNDFKCGDRALINTKRYIREMKISYQDPCIISFENSFSINTKEEKFQKMRIAPDSDATTAGSTLQKNVWIFDDEDLNNTKIIEVCSNGTDSSGNESDERSLFELILANSPWMVITVTFVYGFFTGIIFSCTLNLIIQRKKVQVIESSDILDGTSDQNRIVENLSRITRTSSRARPASSSNFFYATLNNARKHLSRENEVDEFDDSLMLNEFDIPQSTPVQGRKMY